MSRSGFLRAVFGAVWLGLILVVLPGCATKEELPKTYIVTGKVVLKNGKPLAGGFITLMKTLPTIVSSFKGSVASMRSGAGAAGTVKRTERDLPMSVVLIGSAVLIGVLALLPYIPGTLGGKLLLGILIVWTYAAIRPRFGPGPGTALMAGLGPFLAVTLVTLGYTQMGIFVMTSFVKITLTWSLSVAAAALAGGWVYRE